jgi:hypothetical protein
MGISTGSQTPPFLDKPLVTPYLVPPVSFLRSQLFIAIVSLLVLGGFTHAVWGRVVDHDHHVAAVAGGDRHQDSDSRQGSGSEDKGCNHQGCHHGYAMTLVVCILSCFRDSLEVGVPAGYSTWVPDAVPRGIDYPPQLA